MSGLLDLGDFAADAFDDGIMTTEIDSILGNNETETDDFVQEEFCTVPTEIFKNFTAEDFSNTNTIEWIHSLPPRYNHSKNVMDLIAGTDAQKNGALQSSHSGLCLLYVISWNRNLLISKF